MALKVTLSSGRVMLEVTKEYTQNGQTVFDYVMPGNGGGYGVTLTQLIQNIDGIKIDFPSARVTK